LLKEDVMRRRLTKAVALLILCAPWTVAAQGKPTALAGTWVSAPYELPLRTDFDRSVWGPNATSVRDVRFVIASAGESTLTITRKVLDASRQTVKASTSVEEAKVIVGTPLDTTNARTNYTVTLVSAERRYPDDPEYRWPLDGARVSVVTLERDGQPAVEIRFDTPEGKGSFWETLRRESL
jgi:hypothetical protein